MHVIFKVIFDFLVVNRLADRSRLSQGVLGSWYQVVGTADLKQY